MRTTRRGISLVEVLIAIFVMGIGMLSILVLFPLGALNMARALKDDRVGSMSANVDALVSAFNLRNDTSIVNPTAAPPINYFTSPVGNSANPGGAQFLAPDDNGPSYPVWVDPYFYNNSGGILSTLGSSAGGVVAMPAGYPYTLLPIGRVAPSFANTTQLADRWFSLLDDLYFDRSGLPNNFQLGPDLQRQGYFTLACMVRRRKAAQASPVDLWVIAYQGRSVQAPVAESAYVVQSSANPPPVPNVPAKGDTSVTLVWGPGQSGPDLRRGNWLFDTSYTSGTTATGRTYGYVNGKFYRVMDAVNTSTTSMKVEISPPIEDSAQATTVATMVVLDRAVEVFERGTGR
jgi:hypothetical protein